MDSSHQVFHCKDLQGDLPFPEARAGGTIHVNAPHVDTVAFALSIPGACEPGEDPKDAGGSRADSNSVRGMLLFDCVVGLKHAPAMDTDVLRTLGPFYWEKVGKRYAAREAVLYLVGFLAPLSALCISLAGAHTQDDVDISAATVVEAGLCTVWILRQLLHERRQCTARSTVWDHLNDVWNIVDLLVFTLWGATVGLFFAQELWWCKQAAAATVLTAYLKCAHFAQALPGLGRLVQLVLSVVLSMKNFLALLSLAVVGLGLAFMLVFGVVHTSVLGSVGDASSSSSVLDLQNDSSIAESAQGIAIDMEFGSVPISLFRSFTTILGDFDAETLWLRGSPAVAVFMVAMVFGNIVMLNLLIAIVSDEFEQFMERADLEAQLALAAICEEARQVLQVSTPFLVVSPELS